MIEKLSRNGQINFHLVAGHFFITAYKILKFIGRKIDGFTVRLIWMLVANWKRWFQEKQTMKIYKNVDRQQKEMKEKLKKRKTFTKNGWWLKIDPMIGVLNWN